MRGRFLAIGVVTLAAFAAGGAYAQPLQLSVYGGLQGSLDSNVSVSDGTNFSTGWDGKSFEMPPYYGLRATWWLDDLGLESTGIAIDFSHAKIYSRPNLAFQIR